MMSSLVPFPVKRRRHPTKKQPWPEDGESAHSLRSAKEFDRQVQICTAKFYLRRLEDDKKKRAQAELLLRTVMHENSRQYSITEMNCESILRELPVEAVSEVISCLQAILDPARSEELDRNSW